MSTNWFFPRIHLAWITYILRNLYSQVFQKKKKLQKFNTIMKMATKMVSKWSIKIRLKNLKTEANYVLFPFHFQLALIWSFILFSPGPNLNALMPQPYKNAPSQSNSLGVLSVLQGNALLPICHWQCELEMNHSNAAFTHTKRNPQCNNVSLMQSAVCPTVKKWESK